MIARFCLVTVTAVSLLCFHTIPACSSRSTKDLEVRSKDRAEKEAAKIE